MLKKRACQLFKGTFFKGKASVRHLLPGWFLRRALWRPGRQGVHLQGARPHQTAGDHSQNRGLLSQKVPENGQDQLQQGRPRGHQR